MLSIRKETPADIAAIYQVNTKAFDRTDEASLVDKLRDAGALSYSLVAIDGDTVVGYLALSPVTIVEGDKIFHALGLGPVAVRPAKQKQGVGSQLIRYWLENLADEKDNLVVLLGHAGYYPRFGFVVSKHYGIHWQYEAAEENFMVLELRPGALDEISGIVHYHQAFSQV